MRFVQVSQARSVLCASAVLMLGGCAHVKPEQMQSELAKVRAELRSEYQQGDQKLAADLGGRMDALDARLSRVASDLDQLSGEFDVTVERLENAVRFQAPVFFGFDEATIRAEDQAVLDRFAAVIKSSYPGVSITAEGFTDASGSAAYNRKLGKRRADAVVDYLSAQGGLDANQLRAVGYGEDTQRMMDAQRGPGSAGLRNRRVVLVIEGPSTPAPLATQNDTDF
jgi:peptidoglycan-associated lipoprotein